MFAIYVAICVVWVVLNVRVISMIVTMPRSQCRPSTWLVAHMAVIAIMANYSGIIFMIDRFALLPVQRYLGVCQLITFISELTLALVPLNMMALNYDRVMKYRGMNHSSRMLTRRTVFTQWIVAATVSLPSAFSIQHERESGSEEHQCKQVALFGIKAISITVELIRLLILDFFVVGYILQALHRIRQKYRYLYISRPINDERVKAKKVRASFIQAVVFIALWLPLGILICVNRLLNLYNISTSHLDLLIYYGIIIGVQYVSVFPLIQNTTNNKLNYIVWYKCCWKQRNSGTLFSRLTKEIRQESQLGERRRYRQQLRREHLELNEDELITTTQSDTELHVFEKIQTVSSHDDEEEEEEFSTARLTLVEAHVENQDAESSQSESQAEIKTEDGKNTEDNVAITKLSNLDLFRISSVEYSSSSCDNNDAESDDEYGGRSTDSVSNFYSASTSSTKSLGDRVDNFAEEEEEISKEMEMGDTGKLNGVKEVSDLEFIKMLQGSGRNEIML